MNSVKRAELESLVNMAESLCGGSSGDWVSRLPTARAGPALTPDLRRSPPPAGPAPSPAPVAPVRPWTARRSEERADSYRIRGPERTLLDPVLAEHLET